MVDETVLSASASILCNSTCAGAADAAVEEARVAIAEKSWDCADAARPTDSTRIAARVAFMFYAPVSGTECLTS